MTTHTLEELLPIVREVYLDAEHLVCGFNHGTSNIYYNNRDKVFNPRDWNFLMPLAIKLKIRINPEDGFTEVETPRIKGVQCHFGCHTEEQIKDAVIECALAIKGGK